MTTVRHATTQPCVGQHRLCNNGTAFSVDALICEAREDGAVNRRTKLVVASADCSAESSGCVSRLLSRSYGEEGDRSRIGAMAGGTGRFWQHSIILLSTAHAVFLRCMYDARDRLTPANHAANRPRLCTTMHSSVRDLTSTILPCTLDKSVIDVYSVLL
jgi:hypothetical protein